MNFITVKKSYNERKYSECKQSAFIDCSGSTGQTYKIGNSYVTRLDYEKEIAKKILTNQTNIFYWNTQIFSNTEPNGGTEPQCIFRNEKSKQIFDDSEIILFMTDGEINQNDVTEFSNQLKSRLNKALYICVIVSSHMDDISNLNVSVLAPIMMASNVLCLYFDCEKTKTFVVSSKGNISKKYPTQSGIMQQIELSTISLNTISSTQIPTNHIIIEETNTEYKTIDVTKLLDYDYTKLSSDELMIIMKQCLIANKLNEFRNKINETSKTSITTLKEITVKNYGFKYKTERDQLIEKMTIAFMNNNIEEQKSLKQHYDEIAGLAKKEEFEFQEFVKTKLNPEKSKWEQIKSELNALEKSTNKYSLESFSFSSNRAKRAITISDDYIDAIEDKVSFENSPEINCCIHLGKGPEVLWLKENTDLEYSTNDFCVNFPLCKYPNLSKCIISNPVCGDCANSYLKIRKESVYREPICGYVPTNWDSQQNIKFANYIICKSLFGGKLLNHGKMLLLSMIDDYDAKWFVNKNEICKNFITNVITNDTLSEEGNTNKLINIIPTIIKDDEHILRQPFVAIMRILKFYVKYCPNIDFNVIIETIRKSVAYVMIESYMTQVLSKDNKTINDNILELLFETICRIPIQYKNKRIKITDKCLNKFIRPEYVEELINITNLTKTNIDEMISDQIIANVLWHLSKQTEHLRPYQTYTNIILKSNIFRDMNVITNIYDKINNTIFKKYIGTNDYMPSYACYNGEYSVPSKLFFFDEQLFDTDMNNKSISLQSLSDILARNLETKLLTKFGSKYPNNISGHIMLHRIVADVMEHRFDKNIIFSNVMVYDCMRLIKKTNGNYGNIYNPNIFGAVVMAIKDFIRIRQSKNYIHQEHELSKTHIHKLRSELESCGMTIINDMVKFDISLVKKPMLIKIPTYDDVKDILEVVNGMFYNEKESDKLKILEVNYDNGLTIGDSSMNIDEYTKSWETEQLDIVSKIELVDKFKIDDIKYIGGSDITFDKNKKDYAIACITIHDFKTMDLVAKFSMKGTINIPYKAGYLAFREAPLLLKLLDEINKNYNQYMPQIILMDGNGVWHPRGCGIASHFSVLCGMPCIGVSKQVLYVENISREHVQQIIETSAKNKGQYTEIITETGTMLGYAYNITGNAKNATYVSAGNYISHKSAMDIVVRSSKFRVNEAIRQADLISRMLVYG